MAKGLALQNICLKIFFIHNIIFLHFFFFQHEYEWILLADRWTHLLLTGSYYLIQNFSHTRVNANTHYKRPVYECVCCTENTAQCVQSWREPCEGEASLNRSWKRWRQTVKCACLCVSTVIATFVWTNNIKEVIFITSFRSGHSNCYLHTRQ